MPETATTLRNSQNHAKTALMASWRSWVLCVLAPGIWLVFVLVRLPVTAEGGVSSGGGSAAGVWLVGLAGVWLALAGPAVFVVRSYCFRAGWDGRPVEPDSYLKGMGSVWAVLVFGAVLALMGCVVSGQWMPGIVVAGLAIGLILMVRPDGRALGLGLGPSPQAG